MHDAFLIDAMTWDLTERVIDPQGQLRILPAAFWAKTSPAERLRVCVAHGLYCLPTTELVDHLRTFTAGQSALEIGAGNGVLARALCIRATDNRMQDLPAYQDYYRKIGQATVKYGRDVEQLDAVDAVKRYSPDVVVAAWVTHRYDPLRQAAGGNEIGIVEEDVIAGCGMYVLVGNERVHQGKSIWSLPHEISFPPWLYSRAVNGSRDFIAVWRRPIERR